MKNNDLRYLKKHINFMFYPLSSDKKIIFIHPNNII